MADNRQINELYQQIAKELIEARPELDYIKNSDVSIICLSSQHEKKTKKKVVFGQCEKIADKYKWGIPCDFTITVFEPNVCGFTPEQIKILIFHELLHVGIDGDKLFINPHDLEDFKAIIDKFGVDWNVVE